MTGNELNCEQQFDGNTLSVFSFLRIFLRFFGFFLIFFNVFPPIASGEMLVRWIAIFPFGTEELYAPKLVNYISYENAAKHTVLRHSIDASLVYKKNKKRGCFQSGAINWKAILFVSKNTITRTKVSKFFDSTILKAAVQNVFKCDLERINALKEMWFAQ